MKLLRVVFLGLLVFVSLFLVPQVFSQPSLERKIIVFKTVVPQKERTNLLSRYQAVFGKELKLINGVAISLPKGMAEKLAKESGVLRVDPDVEVYALDYPKVGAKGWCDWFPNWPGCSSKPTPTPTVAPSPTPTVVPSPSPSPSPTPSPSPSPSPSPTPTIGPAQTLPWGITRINADDSWILSDGLDVKVGVIDTGIDTDHPDLKNNLAGCVNFISSNKTCEDDNGHGTHVSGIIAAEDNNLGVVGVAPKAKIYSLKVLNKNGSGYLSDIIEALDWAISNHLQVINMSLGTTSNVTSFYDAIKRVNSAGIIQVAAAGNSGPKANSVNYPAKYSEVIAVAAIDSSDQVASWSSRGPQVDLAAPGVNINSTYLNGKYQILSGTSMASPHVAGVVALRLFLHPGESPSQIESVFESNTDPLPVTDPNLVGAGLVNAFKVLAP